MEEVKKEKGAEVDKHLKYSIIVGVLMIGFALFYYLVIKPNQEQSAYTDCLSALKESGRFNDVTIATPLGKSTLDVCAKSNGSRKIMDEKVQKEIQDALDSKQAEERKLESDLAQKAKQLSSFEINNIEITNTNAGDNLTTGTIKNNNSFDVTNVSLKYIITSDKAGNNKIGEVSCDLQEGGPPYGRYVTFYKNSTKKFSQYCSFPKGSWWYSTFIISAEKNKI